ncbi:MAG: fibronectin type III domain-containing protein [Acidimicrobiales bacterium]|nr:fibronectin type III domain-containing protein [Acidimicrobiales bacterium]
MKRSSKKVWSGLLATAVAAAVVPLLSAPAAGAAGVPQPGGASVRTPGGAAALDSGTSASTFTLRLPNGASCGGDSANDDYRVQSYMVPASVDPSTLTFNAAGPIPNTLGAGFRQPLYDSNGSGYVDAQTANATSPPGPGPIINIPDFNYGAVFVPGDIPAGAYNLGIACTLGPAGPDQMKEYWNVTKTFSTNGGDGFANVSWSVGAVPAAPTLTAVTPGDGSLAVAFTAGASTPATTGFTVTATPPAGAPVTATGGSSPITVPGLTNGTEYSVTVRATNSVGSGPESNALTGTPNPSRPAVTGLTATPGVGSIDVDWSYAGPSVTGYAVTVDPAEGTTIVDEANTSAQITGLTAGTLYTVTVTPLYATAPAGTPAQVGPVTPNSAQTIQQHLEVTRPVGNLVLTQVCGAFGALPAGTGTTSPGFPSGSLPAVAAAGPGTAPMQSWDEGLASPTEGSNPDGGFAQYPYPTDADGVPSATYPTHCGIDLGKGKLITSGAGAGQFFAASGRLNQVTVVDTRDTDDGWTVNGTMGAFTKPGASFSGNHLGWNPFLTSDTPAFDDDLDPATPDYSQAAAAGAPVEPRSTGANGLAAGRALGTAPQDSGLGIAVFDAWLKLLIPVTAVNGVYEGTLTFTVA